MDFVGLDEKQKIFSASLYESGKSSPKTQIRNSAYFVCNNQLGLEYKKGVMIQSKNFFYSPGEHEAESASGSYLMSLIAIIVGAPLPILNLLATVIFYLNNRKSTYFVRWHCTQALLSQLSMLFVNSVGFWWTISIIFTKETISDKYVAYMIALVVFNLIEFIATLYTAIQTRKGIHIEWWFYGGLTNIICKESKQQAYPKP